MQFAVYISDTPVTLKQSQGDQTKNDNVDPKQSYKHANFERSCFNDVWEKAKVKSFLFQTGKYGSSLPWTCAQKKKKNGNNGISWSTCFNKKLYKVSS